jgi:hypothetical protein
MAELLGELGYVPMLMCDWRRWVGRLCTTAVWILLVTAAISTTARGQDAPLSVPSGAASSSNSSEITRARAPRNEFGVWGALSAGSPHVIGITGDVQLGQAAFRIGRILVDKPSFAFEWTIDVIPAEIVRQPRAVDAIYVNSRIADYALDGHQIVYGGGVNPIGLKFNFLRERQWQPVLASTGGFVVSVLPVPVDVHGEEQFNFTFDLQAALQHFNSSDTRAWMFGYKYQHISNGYRGTINPGVDFNVIFVGYSFFK